MTTTHPITTATTRNPLWSLPLALLLAALLPLYGCGDDGGDGGGGSASSGEGASCVTSADCGEGEACLAFGGQARCTITCSGSADACSGEASCGTVGVSADVCQPPEAQPTAEDPPASEEEVPRLPCASDAECEQIAPGLICATWKSYSECTRPCMTENDCSIPSAGGVGVDFLTCQTDEGDASRMACVPDEVCFMDPTSCVSGVDLSNGIPGIPGG
ncbi:MAG: hypothetical protein CMH57_02260 [Myxococcales bacterium]|nr:hypothetical protein [Myxococcales bacterium]